VAFALQRRFVVDFGASFWNSARLREAAVSCSLSSGEGVADLWGLLLPTALGESQGKPFIR
jgi:hypothetical protein